MMTPVPRTARHRADPDAAVPPCADCIADSAGGLTFDVTETGEPGAALLVLRRREGHEEVSLPLTPTGDGRLRAALPSGVALPEGRWDAYAQVAGGEPRRRAPGGNHRRARDAPGPPGSPRPGPRPPPPVGGKQGPVGPHPTPRPPRPPRRTTSLPPNDARRRPGQYIHR
ncbi:hypothetical protein ACFWIZ_54460, partial [Streptomyces sp. NPDC127044]